MINPGLRGRSVLVTGTNNRLGIGAAIALAFARLGATLFLHHHRTPLDHGSEANVYRQQQANSADEILRSIRDIGGSAAAYEADFTDTAAVASMLDAAERFCGSVDVLVNNAATWSADTFLPSRESRGNPFIELWTDPSPALSAEPASRQLVVNALSPALLMTEFARRHVTRRAAWGRIVNISTAGSECFPSEASYGASKHALESYTRTAARELGQFGITVNALALGPVQTGWITPSLERALLPTLALSRIGTPDDVADVVVFLASEQARWVTGQKISVDGGHHT
ncbi:MAG TPA: SDR family oxidoreductase [Vicinamibacterales bacterium]|jgi:3-oxoacyl-[acyl-carrier protein] reductase|nr:SDR family oxidoreductase [Vicinamibacterales bacterium]